MKSLRTKNPLGPAINFHDHISLYDAYKEMISSVKCVNI